MERDTLQKLADGIQLFMGFVPHVGPLITLGTTLVDLARGDEDPTPEQNAQIDADLDAGHVVLQAKLAAAIVSDEAARDRG